MKAITHCNRCGYNPAPENVKVQGNSPAEDPRQGDYWLCQICGHIHVYRQAECLTGDQRGPCLVTFTASGAELLDALIALPEMFEESNRIVLAGLSLQRGGRPA